MYRLLMSGDPQLCASLISDGLDSDEGDEKVRLYADQRSLRAGLCAGEAAHRHHAVPGGAGAGARARTRCPTVVAAPKATSFVDLLKGWFSPPAAPKAPPAAAAPAAATPATDRRSRRAG